MSIGAEPLVAVLRNVSPVTTALLPIKRRPYVPELLMAALLMVGEAPLASTSQRRCRRRSGPRTWSSTLAVLVLVNRIWRQSRGGGTPAVPSLLVSPPASRPAVT